jgi:hypothetical protein
MCFDCNRRVQIRLRLEDLTCGLGLVAEIQLDLPAYDNTNTSNDQSHAEDMKRTGYCKYYSSLCCYDVLRLSLCHLICSSGNTF